MSSFYACLPKITITWCMLLRYGLQKPILSFWVIFCPFTPLLTLKNKIWKNVKKPPGDIILLHMFNVNEDHMMYGLWDIKAWLTEFFDIYGHFSSFILLTFWKFKTPGDITILRLCTTNDSHMIYGSWDMECNILSHFFCLFTPLTNQ